MFEEYNFEDTTSGMERIMPMMPQTQKENGDNQQQDGEGIWLGQLGFDDVPPQLLIGQQQGRQEKKQGGSSRMKPRIIGGWGSKEPMGGHGEQERQQRPREPKVNPKDEHDQTRTYTRTRQHLF